MKHYLILAAVSAAFFCCHAISIKAADSKHAFHIVIVFIEGSPHDTSRALLEFQNVSFNTCFEQTEETSYKDEEQGGEHQNLQTRILHKSYRMLISLLCILVLSLLLFVALVTIYCSRMVNLRPEEKPGSDIVLDSTGQKEVLVWQHRTFNLPMQAEEKVLAEQNQPFEQKQTANEHKQSGAEDGAKRYNKILRDTGYSTNAQNDKDMDLSVRKSVAERLAMLNRFVAAIIVPCGLNEAMEELRQLIDDKRRFMETTRLSYGFAHPEFIKSLYMQGLTDSEIGFCCFYTVGLRGKDIANYMEMSQSMYYKFSSNLRKKFALEEKDTNINIFLRNLFSNTAL